MLKVGIADDENIVRVGLQTFINWEENGFELAGLFSNGKEVMDYCMTESLDILITDIKMPLMDGMELIKNIKKIIPDISIIVLSNYDDFPLVSTSFKEGICDYLLKQFVEPVSLINTLDSIKRRKSKKIDIENRDQSPKSFGEKKEDFLRSLILKGNSNAMANDEINKMQLSIGHDNIFLILAKPGSIDNKDEVHEKIGRLHSNICAVIREIVAKYCCVECFTLDSAAIVIILSFPSDYCMSIIKNKMLDIAHDICQTVLSIFNLNLCTGFSKKHGTPGELPDAFHEATEAVQRNFFEPECNMFFYTDIWDAKKSELQENVIKRSIFSSLKIRDYIRMEKAISILFETACNEKSLSPATFKQIIVKILYEIDFYMTETFASNMQQSAANQSEQIIQKIMDCNNIKELYKCTMDIIISMDASYNAINYTPVVDAAKRYIIENYMNHIGLTNVSEHLCMNSSYLCRLFKEKTGENLSYFISKVRIEKSIELMQNLHLNTEEIAEKIGFPNANYFIRVFKRITGRTISEFKSYNMVKFLNRL